MSRSDPTSGVPDVPAPRPASKARPIALGILVLAVVAAFVFGDPKAWLNQSIGFVESLGFWGPVVFALVYVVATVLMVPGSALTLAAGTLFGVAFGTVVVSFASTAGAAAAFLVGRFLACDAIAAKIEGKPAFASLDRALAKEGWKIVGLTRLSPVFPFTLLNYAFGLTQVRFVPYVLASWIGMLPGTVLFVYMGSLARAGAQAEQMTVWQWVGYAVGLVATVAVTVVVTRIARRAIREAGLEPDDVRPEAAPP